MDVVFKKYFWVINLIALALLAFVVASGVTDWAAAKFFAVPQTSVKAGAHKGGKAPRLGRLAMKDSPGEALKERFIFDLDPKVEEGDEPKKAEEPDNKDEGDDKPEGELEESELPIDLEGTAPVVGGVGMSSAVIKVEGETKIAFIGSEFLDGKAKIADIQPRYIVVKEESSFKVVKLWSEKAKTPPPRKNPRFGGGRDRGKRGKLGAGRKPPRPRPAKKTSNNSASKGVKKTGAYSYQIDRKMLDTQLADLSKLGSQARIVPNYRGGKYQGFKLVGVRPGSLYRSIGIRSGDVIKAINGKPIDSPNKAIQLFEQLKNSSNIDLAFERRGQSKTLTYNIK